MDFSKKMAETFAPHKSPIPQNATYAEAFHIAKKHRTAYKRRKINALVTPKHTFKRLKQDIMKAQLPEIPASPTLNYSPVC